MRSWQWLAVPLAIGLFVWIVANPFAHYAVIVELEPPRVNDEGNPVGRFMGWRNGFLPIREIERLNNYKTTVIPKGLVSGPRPYARPNYVVLILLIVGVAALCCFMFGFRPKNDPLRKQKLNESVLAFTLLGLAALLVALLVIDGFSWRLVGRATVLALFGILMLWLTGTIKSRQKKVKAETE